MNQLTRFISLLTKPRVFCISVQRTGTTSVGKFLKDHGYAVVGYGQHSREWSYHWLNGDYERIFKSRLFRFHNGFEDNPWWLPDFYRVLFHRFKKARFIFLYRDSDKWYNSMVSHTDGKVLGNTYRHCKVYRRLDEYYKLVDTVPDFNPLDIENDNLMSLEGKREHYTQIYEENKREIIEFFKKHDSSRLFTCALEDPEKWIKLGQFLNLEVKPDYDSRENVTKKA